MTLPAFGRATPAQIDMLELAGYDLDQSEPRFIRDEQTRLAAMRQGRRSLVEWTGQDYGYDLALWREYLIAYGDRHGYTHPYAFRGVDEAIRRAASDGDVLRLAALAEAGDRDDSP